MGAVVFGDPNRKLLSEPIRYSLFVPLYCPPNPTQPSEFVGIGRMRTTSGGIALRCDGHVNSLTDARTEGWASRADQAPNPSPSCSPSRSLGTPTLALASVTESGAASIFR